LFVTAIMDPRGESKSSWLSGLLAPFSADEFLSRYWLEQVKQNLVAVTV